MDDDDKTKCFCSRHKTLNTRPQDATLEFKFKKIAIFWFVCWAKQKGGQKKGKRAKGKSPEPESNQRQLDYSDVMLLLQSSALPTELSRDFGQERGESFDHLCL